jgi:alpha-beta hydrolase superfamily lysophospholipase
MTTVAPAAETRAAAVVSRPVERTRSLTVTRHENRLFLLAAAVVGLHIVDDNYLQAERGTSAADHVVSGLVPLAALVLCASAYPRLRAGARAAIALTLGVLAVVGAVGEALYYTVEVGPSGDDFTGLLMLPAGLLLVVVGAATLWRGRRLDERRPRRYLRRSLVAVAALVVGFEVVAAVGFAYVFTHAARPVVPSADLGTRYEDVSFRTSDGLDLEGWYVPSRNRAAVIAFPGRKGPQPHARMLARHGYGVLLFDRRGEGGSEGDPNTLGWAGDRDLEAALSYLAARPDVDPRRLGGIGLSVGGEMLLDTAAQSDALRAVVSEGAGTRSVREHVHVSGAAKWVLLPQWSVITAATAVFANQAPPPDLTELVARIAPRPVLLIFTPNGQGAEILNPTFYESAGEPKTLWEIPEASHTGGIEARPAEYERRVIAFLDAALLEKT